LGAELRGERLDDVLLHRRVSAITSVLGANHTSLTERRVSDGRDALLDRLVEPRDREGTLLLADRLAQLLDHVDDRLARSVGEHERVDDLFFGRLVGAALNRRDRVTAGRNDQLDVRPLAL